MRSIRAVIQDAIDNSDIDHIVTVVNANAMVDHICRALEAAGYVDTQQFPTEPGLALKARPVVMVAEAETGEWTRVHLDPAFSHLLITPAEQDGDKGGQFAHYNVTLTGRSRGDGHGIHLQLQTEGPLT